MEKNRKKQIISIVLFSLLLLIFLSFSYFLIASNNDNNEELTSSSALLELTYTDCSESESNDCANISKNLEPGESVSKTFRVENTGSMTLGFEIIFKNLTNTFVNDELVYKILDENEEVILGDRPVPYGSSAGTTIFSDSVREGASKSYKMVVTFKEESTDQEANASATYNITLGIKTDSTIVSRSTLNKLKSLNSSIKVKSVTPNFTNISPMPTLYRDDGIGNAEKSWTPPVNTSYITYGDSYTFNTLTGKYTLVNPQTCKWDECYSSLTGKYYCYNYLYTNTNLHYNDNQLNVYQITSNSTSTKISYKVASKTVLEYDDKDSGLFEAEDDYGRSLYFRGNVTNNYVKFGKNSSNQDMYWRIIRVNGDGTLRIIYDGTSAHANGEVSSDRSVGTSTFNGGSGRPYDAGYVGFMYGNFDVPVGCSCTRYDSAGICWYTCTGGGSASYEEAHANINSSTIKTYLENWYSNNIVNTGYSSFISDETFCNDRTKRNEDLGYGQNLTFFGVNRRLDSNKSPSLICPRKQDTFTKDDSVKGNALLTYPVGLITGDELALGGFVYLGDYNYKTYLYKGFWYWSISPNGFSANGKAHVMTGSNNGSNSYVASTGDVAPVINLTTDAVDSFAGTGTMSDPFYIQE